MALAGYDGLVTASTGSSGTYSSLDGIKEFTISDSRDLLDITDFLDGNVHGRIAGLRDVSLSLSGDFEPADTGYAKVRAAYDAGDRITFQVFTHASSANGAATSGFAFVMRLESVEINGSADGKAEISLSAMIDASGGSAIFAL